jgi:hypothetical protein
MEHEGIPLLTCLGETKAAVLDLRGGDVEVSLGDIKVILMGSILSRLAVLNDLSEEVYTIYQLESQVDALVKQILLETDSPTTHSAIDPLRRAEDLYQHRDAHHTTNSNFCWKHWNMAIRSTASQQKLATRL